MLKLCIQYSKFSKIGLTRKSSFLPSLGCIIQESVDCRKPSLKTNFKNFYGDF